MPERHFKVASFNTASPREVLSTHPGLADQGFGNTATGAALSSASRGFLLEKFVAGGAWAGARWCWAHVEGFQIHPPGAVSAKKMSAGRGVHRPRQRRDTSAPLRPVTRETHVIPPPSAGLFVITPTSGSLACLRCPPGFSNPIRSGTQDSASQRRLPSLLTISEQARRVVGTEGS